MHWQFGEMEFGEMKRNTRIGAIFACFYVARVWQRQLGFLVLTYCIMSVINVLTRVCSSNTVLVTITCWSTLFISCCVKSIIVTAHSSCLILPPPSSEWASDDDLPDRWATHARSYKSHLGLLCVLPVIPEPVSPEQLISALRLLIVQYVRHLIYEEFWCSCL